MKTSATDIRILWTFWAIPRRTWSTITRARVTTIRIGVAPSTTSRTTLQLSVLSIIARPTLRTSPARREQPAPHTRTLIFSVPRVQLRRQFKHLPSQAPSSPTIGLVRHLHRILSPNPKPAARLMSALKKLSIAEFSARTWSRTKEGSVLEVKALMFKICSEARSLITSAATIMAWSNRRKSRQDPSASRRLPKMRRRERSMGNQLQYTAITRTREMELSCHLDQTGRTLSHQALIKMWLRAWTRKVCKAVTKSISSSSLVSSVVATWTVLQSNTIVKLREMPSALQETGRQMVWPSPSTQVQPMWIRSARDRSSSLLAS